MWIVFGLISITLYFAHSMMFELNAADSRVAGVEAEQAIEGARRYLSCLLSNVNSSGVLPDPQTYAHEAAAVGNARYWIIGRGSDQDPPTMAHFGLIDEASKINLNSASSNILINLPRMTPELVNNILAWRSTNTTSLSGGAESDTYMSGPSPYLCKNAPFETLEELRLVKDMDFPTLYGEDANLNGVLDPNENDGETLPPSDNSDGKLDPGLFEYCTVYTREPTTYTNVNSSGATTNSTRLNVSTYSPASHTTLVNLLTVMGITQSRANTIASMADTTGPFPTPLDFYYATKMTTTEFAQVEIALRGASVVGLLNVNSASTAVLSCIPAWINGQASQVTAYRIANSNSIYAQGISLIWITQVLSKTDVLAAAPYLTGHSYQYMADVAALGQNGRGFRRSRFIFDTTQGAPIIVHRQDLSYLGWPLGKEVRDKWLLAKK